MFAKKSLGQNFLVDQNYQKKIISEVAKTSPKKILEIGPGHGALTRHLLSMDCELFLVEKDEHLFHELNVGADPCVRPVLKNHNIHLMREGGHAGPPLQIYNADFLEWDLSILGQPEKNITVVGNLPYNVASQILIKLLINHSYFSRFFLMFQKEVALRIIGKPGTKDYSLLSLWAQIYSEPKILFHLPPTVFNPRPKVDSSLVLFELKKPVLNEKESDSFWQFIRPLFQNRRKTIRAVLKKTNPSIFLDFLENQRAEELSLTELISLWTKLKPALQNR